MSKKNVNNAKDTSKELSKFIEKYNFNELQLSSLIEISPELLTEFLIGRYNWNDSDPNCIRVSEFLNDFNGDFYDTELTGIVFRMLNAVHKEKGFAVITANWGAGKTVATKRYSLINHNALYIRVTGVFCKKYLLIKIMNALGLPSDGMNNFTLFDMIINAVEQRPVTLIFDETERLTPSLIELIRDIYDHGNVGLALVGLENLAQLLTVGRSGKDKLVQVSSRVDWQRVVNILKTEDVEKVFNDRIKSHKITTEKMESLAKYYLNNGGMRSIDKLSKRIVELSAKNKGIPIDDRFVDTAVQKLTLKSR